MKIEEIILYDGLCIFCNKWVYFIIKHDKNKVFKFAPIQSNKGKSILKKIGANIENMDTIYVIKANGLYTKFKASSYALYSVNKYFIFLYSLNFIFPKKFLDFFYDVLGSRRYKIFGKYASCPLPDSNIKDRFIDN